MEKVSGLLELIEKFGTTSVVMVICIIAIYYISKYFVRKFDNLEKRNNELIEKLIEKSKEKVHDVDEDINRSQIINEHLFEIKTILSAKGVKLNVLHNGSFSLNNVPFIKFSETHRTTHSPYAITCLNIPISLNCLWFSLLQDKSINYYINIINSNDKFIVSLLNSRCSHQIISIKLYDINYQICGVLDIEYDEIVEFDYEKIKDIVLKLGYLI